MAGVIRWLIVIVLVLTFKSLYAQGSLEDHEVFNKYFEKVRTLELPEKPETGTVRYIGYANPDSLYLLTGKDIVFLFDTVKGKLEELKLAELFPSVDLYSEIISDFRVFQNGDLYFEFFGGSLICDRKYNILNHFNDSTRLYIGDVVSLGKDYYSFLIDNGRFVRPSEPDFHLETIRLDTWKIEEINSFGHDIYDNALNWIRIDQRLINFGDSLIIYHSVHRHFAKAYEPQSGDYLYRTEYKPSYYNGIDTLGIYSMEDSPKGMAGFLSGNKETTFTRGIYKLNDSLYYLNYSVNSRSLKIQL